MPIQRIRILILIWILPFLQMGCQSLNGLREEVGKAKIPVSSVFMTEEEAQRIAKKFPIRLYFWNEQQENLEFEVRYISEEEAKSSLDVLVQVLLRELFLGPQKDGLEPLFAKQGAMYLKASSFRDGIVHLDFQKDFYNMLEKDAQTEALKIRSLVNTLTEIREVDRVQFLQDGKMVEAYEGKEDMKKLFYRKVYKDSLSLDSEM